MREPHVITDDQGASALADRLNGDARTRPIVVVTTPAGRREPFIDAAQVADQVGDLADVYLIATGPHTWVFSDKMPERTQVYGGAGRVYPIGHGWVARPQESPLRFAYNEEEGLRSARALVSDALSMAAHSGLFATRTGRNRRQVQGQVRGIPVPERALVELESGSFAPVAQELTLPGVPLDRVLRVGMTVSGWLDSETRRLDISESLLEPDPALAAYAPGDLVLAQVETVEHDRATVLLHPRRQVTVSRDEVTGNDLDDLRNLMTPGEVVAARVTANGTGPSGWRLSMLDVDDDEAPRSAPSVLPDGPPWLEAPATEVPIPQWVEADPVVVAAPSVAAPAGMPATPETPPVAPDGPPAVAPAALRPTPAMFDRRRVPSETLAAEPVAAPVAAPAARSAATTMSRTIDALKAEVARLSSGLSAVEDELRAAAAERATLVEIRRSQELHLAHKDRELKAQRALLRKAKRRPAPVRDQSEPTFADPEQGFRYAVLTAWASRTPVGEQAARPLLDYDLGPHFLDSVRLLQGVSADKIADVVVEIVTGRAKEVPGREVHLLREGDAAGAAPLRREDGATCWRAALQRNTPQARRIHYWLLPGGRVELARVVQHDDFTP